MPLIGFRKILLHPSQQINKLQFYTLNFLSGVPMVCDVLSMDTIGFISIRFFPCFILLVAFALVFFHIRLNIVHSLVSIRDLQLVRHGVSL
jgi:hypothetical protein